MRLSLMAAAAPPPPAAAAPPPPAAAAPPPPAAAAPPPAEAAAPPPAEKPPAGPPPPSASDQMALKFGRLIHAPSHIVPRMTESSMLVGAAAHNAVGASSAAVGKSLLALGPKEGTPAMWLTKFFAKTVPETVAHSAEKADRNVNVIWKPASDASEKMGMVAAGPFLYKYAKGAGFPEPSNPDLLSALAHSKGYPTPPPPEAAG